MFEINFTLVSPSKVGIYASCPWLLVEDSLHLGSKFTGNKWADYGTVCHWLTMERLGCAPQEQPTKAQKASARELEPSANDDVYKKRLTRCVDLAEKALITELGPLLGNERWVSEVPVHDKSLLPTRKSRDKLNEDGTITPGKVVGFGGSMDLKTSNNTIIVDLKFVSKPVTVLKIEYLWQLGSYAMLSGIMTTMILWIKTDGKDYWHLTIDWTEPRYAMLMEKIRKFVERTGHANFAAHAYPVEGPHCEYCHKNPSNHFGYIDGGNKCPLKHIPTPTRGNDSASTMAKAQAIGGDWLADVEALAAASSIQNVEMKKGDANVASPTNKPTAADW
jgi:hypothetical protein